MTISDPSFKLSQRERCFGYVVVGFFVLCVIGAFQPLAHMHYAQGSHWMETSRDIVAAMAQYADDHGGKYPDGNSSTEIFQKLLDENYVKDPAVFYVPYPGKAKAVAGEKLKPENVSWDVTAGVDPTSSDEIPVVFLTGYRVTYLPGSAVLPLVKPYPDYGDPPRTWSQWWHGEPAPRLHPEPGIAVGYKGNSAAYKMFMSDGGPDGTLTNFVSSTFDPKGKVYRQLTPDGPLAK